MPYKADLDDVLRQDNASPRHPAPLPAEARKVADAFLAYKQEHPEPVPEDQMTPLQRRMQSGGIGEPAKPRKGLGHRSMDVT